MAVDTSQQALCSNDTLTGNILRGFLLPSILALLASNLSGIIGTMIIGDVLSARGLAAMSLVAPVTLIYFTLGSMVAVGSSIMASISLGENKKKLASTYFGWAFIIAGGLGLLFTLLGFVLLDPIVALLGAEGDLIPLVRSYCGCYIAGGTATLMFYIPFNFVRSMGRPRSSMTLLMVVGTINVLLTLLFVYVLGLGTAGVALATVIGQAVGFGLGCCIIFGKGEHLRPRRPHFNWQEPLSIVSAGSAAALNNLSRAITVILLNSFFAAYIGQLGLTLFAVARNVSDLFLVVSLGSAQAIVPIIGLLYGERDALHIGYVMRRACRLGVRILACCGVFILLFSAPITRLFGVKDLASLGASGRIALICVAFSLILSFINTLFLNYYNAIKIPLLSNSILAMRTTFTILCAYGLGSWLGEQWVWFYLIVAELLTLLGWLAMLPWVRRRMYRKEKIERTSLLLCKRSDMDEARSLNLSILCDTESIIAASERVGEFCVERSLSPKQSTMLSLSVEELLVLVDSQRTTDSTLRINLRVFIYEDMVTLRIRYAGERFNPVTYWREQRDIDPLSDAMGVGIIFKNANLLEYNESLGVNNLLIVV